MYDKVYKTILLSMETHERIKAYAKRMDLRYAPATRALILEALARAEKQLGRSSKP